MLSGSIALGLYAVPRMTRDIDRKQMTDTPQHIKELHLKLWLSQSPMEKLKQILETKGRLLQFWSSAHVIDKGHNDRKPKASK
jgi:hypothetical protein